MSINIRCSTFMNKLCRHKGSCPSPDLLNNVCVDSLAPALDVLYHANVVKSETELPDCKIASKASIDSGSVTPWIISTEAPWKIPATSLAIAAAAALPVFLEIAASTFIFVTLSGGAIHAGTCCLGPLAAPCSG
jgi:hypothetical protein